MAVMDRDGKDGVVDELIVDTISKPYQNLKTENQEKMDRLTLESRLFQNLDRSEYAKNYLMTT